MMPWTCMLSQSCSDTLTRAATTKGMTGIAQVDLQGAKDRRVAFSDRANGHRMFMMMGGPIQRDTSLPLVSSSQPATDMQERHQP